MKAKIIFFIFLLFLFTHNTNCFDWLYYIQKYKDLNLTSLTQALDHYATYGISSGYQGVPEPVPNTNFDWEYYVQHNELNDICSEKEALEHYQKIGFFNNLPYYKKLKIIILLHLYDGALMDEFIDKINKFMHLNDLNEYYIKINIPIDENIVAFDNALENQKLDSINRADTYEKILAMTPYHKNLVTAENSKQLYAIYSYLKEYLTIDQDKLQVIFSENRGVDIGGFFLLLDQVIKQNIEHDYIIKLHTKKNNKWRKVLTAFLDLKVNKLLRQKDFVYSNKVYFDYKNEFSKSNVEKVLSLLNNFNLPQKNFYFCGGTMFIVSNKIINFFKNYDLFLLFNTLNGSNKYTSNSDGQIEHAYERFFGYLAEYLDLKTQVVGNVSETYVYDNKMVQDKNVTLLYDQQYIRILVDKHNIKTMAFYFPQFHEVEENNQFWGHGFTEWTMLNKYQGEIKRPHFDIGQYNMLDYEARKKQRIIAKKYGINAFCYYHYWFKDRKVMYKGIEKKVEDGEPDIPFVLCWANEPWTRNWDGLETEVLLSQEYGTQEDWIKHYNYLLQFFKHPNYIKENNCPLLYIYKMQHLTEHNALPMLSLWKEMIKKDGFDGLKIISVLINRKEIKNLDNYIDGYAEHQPNYNGSFSKVLFKIKAQHNIDAQSFYESMIKNQEIGDSYSRGLFYSWDNSSRRIGGKASYKFVNLSYRLFEKLLQETIVKIAEAPNEGNNFIMLNAWNEWTEQAMLEPNDRDGYSILNIIKKYFSN